MARTPRSDETVTEDIVDPTINDDINGAYDIGSRWINTAADRVWYCVDTTAGAAVWKDVSTPGAGSHPVTVSAVDPVVTDDSNAGHGVGDHWINSVTQDIFQVADVTLGAAVWRLVTGSGPLACSDNVISIDLIVPSGKTCFAHSITIADGIELSIQSAGELLLL